MKLKNGKGVTIIVALTLLLSFAAFSAQASAKGSKIPAAHIYRSVNAIDIAPTLSRYVGAKPPSGSSGYVLEEIFSQ